MEQFNVTGMSCAACSARVEKAVKKVPGVTSCSVSLLTNSMGVEGTASASAIIKAVQDAGYGASPKSNSAHDAINAAIADVQAGRTGPIPRQLQNKHFDGEDAAVKGQNYKYAHDYENHWVDQQYLPDLLKDVKYYTFGDNRTEQAARAYWAKIKGEDKL